MCTYNGQYLNWGCCGYSRLARVGSCARATLSGHGRTTHVYNADQPSERDGRHRRGYEEGWGNATDAGCEGGGREQEGYEDTYIITTGKGCVTVFLVVLL